MFKRVFNSKQTSILSAAFIIASMVATSRILGLIKNRLLTARFTPQELDPYWAAFRVPDFLFEILIAGAVSVAFIPVFTSYLSRNKEKEAHIIASSMINGAGITVLLCAVIYYVFAPFIIQVIVPGFSSGDLQKAVSLSRVLIIFQVLPLVVGNFYIAILQSYRRFLIPALAPVVYNIGSIAGIIFLTEKFGLFGPLYGVILGAILFVAIQIPSLMHVGFHHSFLLQIKHKGVKEILKLMLPRLISVSVTQIDITIDTFLASLVGAGSITVLTFSRQLQIIPLMLFGFPIAQAALPTFSEYVSHDKIALLKKSLLASFYQILFFIFPASALLIVLKVPIVRLIYGADRFDWPSTVLTARTLAAFGISLFAQAASVLFLRAFFSLNDSKTPVIIGVITVMINSILSILFIQVVHLPIWGLGLSASIASVLNALFLFYFLDKKLHKFDRVRLIVPFIKIVLSTIIMAIPLYVFLKLFDQLVFDTTRTINLILLTGTITSIGIATYIFFAWLFKIEEVMMFYAFAQKVAKVKEIFFEPERELSIEKQ